MLLSPFSVPLGYDSPSGKGVYLKPFSNANPDGWGEPRMDNTQTPPVRIEPGTPGGEHERVLVRKKGTEYKTSATKHFQKSGNISWWGPLVDQLKPNKGRRVLSYNGPKLRYFREPDFEYGASSAHNEIYYQGGYAAVAPGPVLGAAIAMMDWYDPSTTQTSQQRFLVAVIRDGSDDIFLRKRWDYKRIAPYKMTDEVRQFEMEYYSYGVNDTGWVVMGTVPRQGEAYPAETPWFFSENGLEAVCLRRVTVAFNNGYENLTQSRFDRYRVSVSAQGGISFTNAGNSQPFQYTETITKIHPTYQSTDHEGFTHDWQEDHVKVLISMLGEQYVFADYIGNELYYGKVKYRIYRSQVQYFTKGTDPASYVVFVNNQNQNISNRDLRVGPYWHNYFEYWYLDPDYLPAEGDHEATKWIDFDEEIVLYWGPVGNSEQDGIQLHSYKSGPKSEWQGLPEDPGDPWLYYFGFLTLYFRGLFDIRQLTIMALHSFQYSLLHNNPSNLNAEGVVDHKTKLYTAESSTWETYHAYLGTSSGVAEAGWDWQDMDTWPQTINVTLSRTSYEGGWPTDNHTGAVQVPGNKTYYAGDTTGNYGLSWPSIPDLLWGTSTLCKGNGVITDLQEAAFSLEIPNPEKEGEYVVVSDMVKAGKPETVVGYGEKFYPVGTC